MSDPNAPRPSPGPYQPDVPTLLMPGPATEPQPAPAPPPGAPPSVPGYEVLGELGRGGMGVVYKARQVALNRVVALKVILAGGHAGKEDLARFRLEAESVARLQHPGIVQIYDVGVHNGTPYFSLEFCGGGSLAARLNGTPLPPADAAELVETVARAAHAAHQAGVVHRDLKPANVLLAGAGRESRGEPAALAAGLGAHPAALGVHPAAATNPAANAAGSPRGGSCAPLAGCGPKITDFGLAKVLDACTTTVSGGGSAPVLTETGIVLGTPSYMPPEQAGGHNKEVGAAADVYGLGAILYECLTGRPPFVAATQFDTVLQVLHNEPLPPRMLNRRLDADLEKITLKCLQKQPADRYASAEALADDLRRYRNGEPVAARSVNLLERLQRELGHSQHETFLRPWGLGLMLLGALILLAHLATSLLLWAHCPRILSFWVPRSVFLALAVPLFWRFRPSASVWPTNAVERLIWAVWLGYLLTFLSLFWVMQVLKHDHLHIYGVATAVGGLAWFAMGGHVWGGCYVIGLAFLLLAPAMALLAGSPWSPFCFGLLWGAALLVLGRRYWKRGQAPG
jgi:serine/threonine protein kinase